jgi:fructose-bisphosphate aldolase class 1
MVETYTFHISYPNNEPEISLRTATRKGNQKTVTQQDIGKSITQLMRTLVVLMQSLTVSASYAFGICDKTINSRCLIPDIW